MTFKTTLRKAMVASSKWGVDLFCQGVLYEPDRVDIGRDWTTFHFSEHGWLFEASLDQEIVVNSNGAALVRDIDEHKHEIEFEVQLTTVALREDHIK